MSQEKLVELAKERTELNRLESAVVKLFQLRDDMLSKYVSNEIDWEALGMIIEKIRAELKINSNDIKKE